MFHYVLFNDALLFFLFSRRIALQSISYMVKTFAAKPLVAKMFTAEELMPKISPDHLLHPRCLWICMGSLPSSLCASAHLFPLLRTPGGIPLIASHDAPPIPLPALSRHWRYPAVLSHPQWAPWENRAHISSLIWTMKECTPHPRQ